MYFPFLIILKLCNDREILILWWRLHRKGGRIENIPIHQGISSEKRTKRKKEEKKNVRCGTKCIGSSQIASIRLHNSLTAAAASSQCFSLLSFFFYLWLFNLGGNCLHSSVILQHIVCKCFPSLFFSLFLFECVATLVASVTISITFGERGSTSQKRSLPTGRVLLTTTTTATSPRLYNNPSPAYCPI